MTCTNVIIQNTYTEKAHKLNYRKDFLTILNRWIINLKSRRDLARLSDDQLKDIGVSRQQALKEANRAFWQ